MTASPAREVGPGQGKQQGEAVLLPSYEEALRETGAGTARRFCGETQAQQGYRWFFLGLFD